MRDGVVALQEQAESVTETRQVAFRKQQRLLKPHDDLPHVVTYLYRGMDVDYPVLATVASLAERLQYVDRRLETAKTVRTE